MINETNLLQLVGMTLWVLKIATPFVAVIVLAYLLRKKKT